MTAKRYIAFVSLVAVIAVLTSSAFFVGYQVGFSDGFNEFEGVMSDRTRAIMVPLDDSDGKRPAIMGTP